MYREYLGDGVYAEVDGYHIVLTAEDGEKATDRISLDGALLLALDSYRRIYKDRLAKNAQTEKTDPGELRKRARERMDERGWRIQSAEDQIWIVDEHGGLLSRHNSVEEACEWVLGQ